MNGTDTGVAVAAADGHFERGSFTGSAREYFGIWIVNILLTILTIGIYSAWAKVRRKRYFQGNTELAGRRFEYHARGVQIFVGRLIALAIILVLNLLSYLNPFLALVASLLFMLFLPWMVMRSLRFNARVTSYRNVRFDFTGTTGGAFVAIILGGFIAVFSLGILAPLASRWLHRYVFNNLHYGDRPFSTDPRLGALYRVWWLPALLTFLGVALVALVAVAAVRIAAADVAGDPMGLYVTSVYFSMFVVLVVLSITGLLYRIGVRNVVWSAARLDDRHALLSDLSRWRYLWIAFSNLVVTVLTLGLLRPWAAVREARYVAEHSGIRFDGDVGEVLSAIEATGSAVSAEYLDMEGFDFGF